MLGPERAGELSYNKRAVYFAGKLFQRSCCCTTASYFVLVSGQEWRAFRGARAEGGAGGWLQRRRRVGGGDAWRVGSERMLHRVSASARCHRCPNTVECGSPSFGPPANGNVRDLSGNPATRSHSSPSHPSSCPNPNNHPSASTVPPDSQFPDVHRRLGNR